MSSEKVKFKRNLLLSLSKGRSAFLWGPRKTGKTTLLNDQFPDSTRYNLLESDTFFRLSKEPYLLRQELLALGEKVVQPVIIDEIQKAPQLLDEVHLLIESKGLSFILCGSSARKLKKAHANMLGGRAWRFELLPLTTDELAGDFDLLKACNHGLIPAHYIDDDYQLSLKAYISDYLKEEIQQEGLVRNLSAFARFLDTIPFSNGALVNYLNISRECGVDSKTVAAYYQILVDTLLGRFVEPYKRRVSRMLVSATPRFYLFDVGVAGALGKRMLLDCYGPEFGRAFEHFIFMELTAYKIYSGKDFAINYWRTRDGLEVDFILDAGKVAVEVKGSKRVDPVEMKGINAFIEENRPVKAFVVCQESVERMTEKGVLVISWNEFLKRLWAGEVV